MRFGRTKATHDASGKCNILSLHIAAPLLRNATGLNDIKEVQMRTSCGCCNGASMLSMLTSAADISATACRRPRVQCGGSVSIGEEQEDVVSAVPRLDRLLVLLCPLGCSPCPLVDPFA